MNLLHNLIYRSKPFAELRPLPASGKRKRQAIDFMTLPAFGIWKERINRAGGTEKFLKQLRAQAWQ